MRKNISFQFIIYSLAICFIPLCIIYGNLYFYLIDPVVEYIDKLHQNLLFLFEETVPLQQKDLSLKKILQELNVSKKGIEKLIFYIHISSLILIIVFGLLITCISLIIILKNKYWLKQIDKGLKKLLNFNFTSFSKMSYLNYETLNINKTYEDLFFVLKKEKFIFDLLLKELVEEQENLNFKNMDLNKKQSPSYNFFFIKIGFSKVGLFFIEHVRKDENLQMKKNLWLFLYSYFKKNLNSNLSLKEITKNLHSQLSPFIDENNLYFNLFTGIIDLSIYHFDFINIGFQGAIRLDLESKLAQMLIHKEMVLPFGKTHQFESYKIKLNSQDKIFLYNTHKILLTKQNNLYQLFYFDKGNSPLIQESNLKLFFEKILKLIKNDFFNDDICMLDLK